MQDYVFVSGIFCDFFKDTFFFNNKAMRSDTIISDTIRSGMSVRLSGSSVFLYIMFPLSIPLAAFFAIVF